MKAGTSGNGIEGLSAAFVSYAQIQLEETMRTAQTLLACRTLEDMAHVQNQFMQQSFDRFLAEANKLAQTTATFAKEQAGPLSDQMESLMQSMNRVA